MRCETHMGGSERRRFLDKGRTATWFRDVYVVNGENIPPVVEGIKNIGALPWSPPSLQPPRAVSGVSASPQKQKPRVITIGIGSPGKGVISLVHHLVVFLLDIVQFPALGFRIVCLSDPQALSHSHTHTLSLGRKAVVRPTPRKEGPRVNP